MMAFLQNKNKQHFETELYNSHYKRIYNTCLRIVGNTMEAEEAMHDTFLKIFANYSKINDEKAFFAWSKSIAVRTAIDRIRKKKIYFESVENLAIIDEEQIDENEIMFTVEKIKQKLVELADGYRIILSMRLFENYSFEEISDTLKIKESSVRSQYVRGREKLVQLLK